MGGGRGSRSGWRVRGGERLLEMTRSSSWRRRLVERQKALALPLSPSFDPPGRS